MLRIHFKIINYLIKIGVVTNSSDDTALFESSLDLNKLKKCKKKHPRKKKLDLDKEKMNYNCGWKECFFESSCIREYLIHVSEHVDYLWTEEWQSNKESIFIPHYF